MTEQKGSCGCGCVPVNKPEPKSSCGCGCNSSEPKKDKLAECCKVKNTNESDNEEK